MSFVVQIEAPPIREDADGSLRVGTSRVLVDLVVRAFRDGATPETIAQSYPSASLTDIYGVIAYYLRHTSEVDAYLSRRRDEADGIQKKIESSQRDMQATRKRILAEKERRKSHASNGG